MKHIKTVNLEKLLEQLKNQNNDCKAIIKNNNVEIDKIEVELTCRKYNIKPGQIVYAFHSANEHRKFKETKDLNVANRARIDKVYPNFNNKPHLAVEYLEDKNPFGSSAVGQLYDIYTYWELIDEEEQD